jgi:hypothetical protein
MIVGYPQLFGNVNDIRAVPALGKRSEVDSGA